MDSKPSSFVVRVENDDDQDKVQHANHDLTLDQCVVGDNGDTNSLDSERAESLNCSLEEDSLVAIEGTPFSRLPSAVIRRVLYLADANSFASLSLLNRQWRSISNCTELYRHHLIAYCSLAWFDSSESDSIEKLKRKFAYIARAYTFEVFLRPTQTVINLVSESASSSSAFPQGEAFRFDFSAYGRLLLGLSSSRIFVLDLTLDPPSVRHELKIRRRPTAATILDDGSLLAVASGDHRLRVYSLVHEPVALLQTIELNEIPRGLSISPSGGVLAVTFDGGIEVHAIGENVPANAHRAIRCSGVSNLSFSSDGSMLLGSSTDIRTSTFVTISPPLITDPTLELSLAELQCRMWTTQILFADNKNGYSLIDLIPSADGANDSVCFVGYDPKIRAFRIAQVDDPRGNTVYFVGPGADINRDEPYPYTLPTTSENGEFLAVAYENSGIWIYGIPTTRMGSLSSEETQPRLPEPTIRRIDAFNNIKTETTNFQRLNKSIEGDHYIISGCPLDIDDRISNMRWTHKIAGCDSTSKKPTRLVAVASGGVESSLNGERVPVDGGKIILYDFEHSLRNGDHKELIIEVGEPTPIELPERRSTLDVEVEIERRRTFHNRQRGLGTRRLPSEQHGRNGLRNRRASIPQVDDLAASDQLTPAEAASLLPLLDNPYSNTSPRSTDILRRAATAASRSLAATLSQNARPALSSPGRRRPFVIPHESDADNWVPPPPPYSADDENPLPEHIQRTLLPSLTSPLPHSGSNILPRTNRRRSRTSEDLEPVHRARTTIDHMQRRISRRPVPSTEPAPPPDFLTPSRIISAPETRPQVRSVSPYRPPPADHPNSNLHQSSPISSLPPRHYHSPRPSVSPPSVIGRNGPSHHLSEDFDIYSRNSSGSPVRMSWPSQSGLMYGSSTTTTPRPNIPAGIPQSLVPGIPTPSNRPQLSLSSLVLGDSLTPTSQDLGNRSNRWVAPAYAGSQSTLNVGVERSRSRSQDVPRRRPLVPLLDRRTGRKILSSQSDIGLGMNTRTDEWREQWSKFVGEKRKKKDAKCIVM
ncbi:hypothetical protein FQN57_004222 [Myotisia sp. PD_48]|nr:hypothetical protein FQN57_004222 [Myotisia sp. PD_48]